MISCQALSLNAINSPLYQRKQKAKEAETFKIIAIMMIAIIFHFISPSSIRSDIKALRSNTFKTWRHYPLSLCSFCFCFSPLAFLNNFIACLWLCCLIPFARVYLLFLFTHTRTNFHIPPLDPPFDKKFFLFFFSATKCPFHAKRIHRHCRCRCRYCYYYVHTCRVVLILWPCQMCGCCPMLSKC